METPRLDRTYHWRENTQRIKAYWDTKSMRERLEVAYYLNSVAYNYDINNPPKMDKTVFSMRKNNQG